MRVEGFPTPALCPVIEPRVLLLAHSMPEAGAPVGDGAEEQEHLWRRPCGVSRPFRV